MCICKSLLLQNPLPHISHLQGLSPICVLIFTQNGDLRRHIRTLTGDKPYKCDICGKGFCVNHHLQAHIRTHTGDNY
jgi:uncharacterized Zn-finger protein